MPASSSTSTRTSEFELLTALVLYHTAGEPVSLLEPSLLHATVFSPTLTWWKPPPVARERTLEPRAETATHSGNSAVDTPGLIPLASRRAVLSPRDGEPEPAPDSHETRSDETGLPKQPAQVHVREEPGSLEGEVQLQRIHQL